MCIRSGYWSPRAPTVDSDYMTPSGRVPFAITLLASQAPAGIGVVATSDLFRFILGCLALIAVPGYAASVWLRPHSDWIEHLAFSMPCGYAIAAISGLLSDLVHLPFDLVTYAVVAVPVTALGVRTWRRRRFVLVCSTDWRWPFIPLGVSAAQVGAVLAVHAHDVVPAGSDVVSHVMWTNAIAKAHVFPIALMSQNIGSGDGAFYPPDFHAVTALVLAVAPTATYKAVFYSVVVMVALLPIVLYCFTRRLTGSSRVAALASIASLAFEPRPLFVMSLGFYPLIAALLIVPTLAITLRQALVEGDRRPTALASALGIGLFYTHPTEFITVGLIVLALAVPFPPGRSSWRRAAGVGLVIGTAWAIAAAPAIRAVLNTMVSAAQGEMTRGRNFQPAAQVDVVAVVRGYVYWVFGLNVSYLLLAAALVGVAWCLAKKRLYGLVTAQAILLLVFVDSYTYNILRSFYRLAYPWPLFDRLAATHYWLVLPLAAVGLDAFREFVWRRLKHLDLAFVAIVASPIVLLGIAVPLNTASGRAASYYGARNVVASADFGAIDWLAHHAPSGSTVLNDADLAPPPTFDTPIDAGLWMPALGGPMPLIWRGGSGPGAMADRVYLLQHISDFPLPRRAERLVDMYHVKYVFYGAGIRPGALRHLRLARLLADPDLRLVYASPLTCHGVEFVIPGICPSRGSYVFAIEDSTSTVGE